MDSRILLSYYYGDKKACIDSIRKEILKYMSSPQTVRVKNRIEYYIEAIKEMENDQGR